MDVGLWVSVVILSSSDFEAVVSWYNKYVCLTVSELFVYLLLAMSQIVDKEVLSPFCDHVS